MKIHRFIGEFDFSKGKLKIKDRQIIHQIKNVLKLKSGEIIVLINQKLEQATTVILKIEANEIWVKIEKIGKIKEPVRKVILYCSILKRDNFEWVVQKVVEIGVSKIIPIICSRTIKTNVNLVRLLKIAKEATEQCERASLPEITEPIKFRDAIDIAQNNEINIFCQRFEKNFDIGILKNKKSVGIFIGPEGGWTDEEIDSAKAAGFQLVGLGPTVLRAETAAVIASYLAL